MQMHMCQMAGPTSVYHVGLKCELSTTVLSEVEGLEHLKCLLCNRRYDAGTGVGLRWPVAHG